MKIRALPSFEGIRDNERNVYPKEGEVWEVSEERANFLKSHGVIEFVEEVNAIVDTKEESENIKPLNEEKLEEVKKQIEEHIQVPKSKKKKSSKK